MNKQAAECKMAYTEVAQITLPLTWMGVCTASLCKRHASCIRLGRLIYDHFSLFVGFVKWIKVRVISVRKKQSNLAPGDLKKKWETDELIMVVALYKFTLLLCLELHLCKNVWNTLLAGARTSFTMLDIVQFGCICRLPRPVESVVCLKDSVHPATNLL